MEVGGSVLKVILGYILSTRDTLDNTPHPHTHFKGEKKNISGKKCKKKLSAKPLGQKLSNIRKYVLLCERHSILDNFLVFINNFYLKENMCFL